jgi:hypothetical protein
MLIAEDAARATLNGVAYDLSGDELRVLTRIAEGRLQLAVLDRPEDLDVAPADARRQDGSHGTDAGDDLLLPEHGADREGWDRRLGPDRVLPGQVIAAGE